MDVLDLFIGSEGTLAVVIEIETRLLAKPQGLLSGVVFFESETDVLSFVADVRSQSLENRQRSKVLGLDARALEFFDSESLDFLRQNYPNVPDSAVAAIFFEQETTSDSEDSLMSAVINEKAFKSINGYIEKGKNEGGRVLIGGGSDGEQGFFIEPTVIADVKPGATIEQEEIFGPVLAVIKANDYDDALKIANDTQFGLTGAVYSADEGKLQRARREFHVGNLYLNRKCTGALVGVHPFGGFNMSGTDSKAGGRDYLLLFLQAKVSAEKMGATTNRRAEAGTSL